MDQIMLFLQHRWFVVIIAFIVLFIVIKIIKAIVKWILVLAIIAAVLLYGLHYAKQIKTVGSDIVNTLEQHALSVIAGEAKNAKYISHDDGTFSLVMSHVTLTGSPASDKIQIIFQGHTFTITKNQWIQSYIDQAKEKG